MEVVMQKRKFKESLANFGEIPPGIQELALINTVEKDYYVGFYNPGILIAERCTSIAVQMGMAGSPQMRITILEAQLGPVS
jgi:hypothetical protein